MKLGWTQFKNQFLCQSINFGFPFHPLYNFHCFDLEEGQSRGFVLKNIHKSSALRLAAISFSIKLVFLLF